MNQFLHAEEHQDQEMIMIQANLDDMNPEWTTHVMNRLFAAGANDVFWIPIVMKKGRPGMMLNVFTARDKLEEMEEIIFSETTTLGVRYSSWTCHRLGRQFYQVETPWGYVTVKVGIHQGEIVQYAPEYADCEAISKAYKVPLKQVYDAVRVAYKAQLK